MTANLVSLPRLCAFSLEGEELSNKALRFVAKRYVHFKSAILNADMHVISDAADKLGYLPIPKAACSTLKFAFLRLENEQLADAYHADELKRIHQYFSRKPQNWVSLRDLRRKGSFRFTVVRDPIDRFMSAYQNRVVDYSDLENKAFQKRRRADLSRSPSIDELALNLHAYCETNASINHHVRPQAEFIRDKAAFDRIYAMSDLPALADDVFDQTGVRLTLAKSNSSKTEKPRLAADALEALQQFYAVDYEFLGDILTAVRPLHRA